MNPTIVWFRRDLRLQDNPALHAAVRRGAAIVPLYIHDDEGDGRWLAGGASRWWLHHSLAALDASLRVRASGLVLARGESGVALDRLIRETGADAVYWNRRYEPLGIVQDAKVQSSLTARGMEVQTFNAALLNEPQTIANRQGLPFQVFTPYWRHCLQIPVAVPTRLGPRPWQKLKTAPGSLALGGLDLLPRVPWDVGFRDVWTPGETGAMNRLRRFVTDGMEDYVAGRNRPGWEGTSRLSPHLHFGEIGPRQVWAAVRAASRGNGVFPPGKGAAVFLSELGWREFAHHLLFHFNHTPEQPLREQFARFRWGEDPDGVKLKAWQRGRTGYPLVDAGMRQLWRTGWMHNRVRMITGSFLVKHLRLPWTAGAAWFWDTLVDSNLANNTLGWQWIMGCGADAAPYFRIFSPELQGRKFDADGDYVRRWVPELAGLGARYIHAPSEAPPAELAAAGIRLGDNYPHPIVEHATARRDALAAYQQLRDEVSA